MKRNKLILFFMLTISSAMAGTIAPYMHDTDRLIKIAIIDKQAMLDDSVTCQYWDYYLNASSSNNTQSHTLKCAAQNASFVFSTPTGTKCVYVVLKKGKTRLLSTCLAEAGDDITIEIKGSDPMFSGKGASKYQCRYEMEKAMKVWSLNPIHATHSIKLPEGVLKQFAYPGYIKNAMAYMKQKMDTAMQVLACFRNAVTNWSYEIMKADIYSRIEMDKLEGFVNYYYNMEIPIPIKQKDSLQHAMLDSYNESRLNLTFSNDVQVFSAGYNSYIADVAYHAQVLYHQKGNDWIIQNYKGEQRDKLLTAYLLQTTYNTPGDVLQQTASMVKAFPWKEMMMKLLNHQAKGVAAYPFELTDSAGHIVRLEDFKGKAVMLEFWFTGCSGCAEIARNMPQVTKAFTGNDKMVFASVSIDIDFNTWQKSLQSKKYTGPGYVNMYTGGNGIDHPLIKYYQLQACPKTLIIDKNGNIFSNLEPDFNSQTSIDNYIALLQQAQQ